MVDKSRAKFAFFSAMISGKNPKPVSYGELSTRRDWTKNAEKNTFSREKSENGKSPFYFSHIIS